MQQFELESDQSSARRTIVQALNGDPDDSWTRERLAMRYGLSQSVVARVLADLVSAGVAYRLPGADDEYAAAGTGA
jgi:hypothetical protein